MGYKPTSAVTTLLTVAIYATQRLTVLPGGANMHRPWFLGPTRGACSPQKVASTTVVQPFWHSCSPFYDIFKILG